MIGFFSLHGVLDDLGLFHLHCVDVVHGVYVYERCAGGSVRVRDLLCDFRNFDDLLLLSTESEESRTV